MVKSRRSEALLGIFDTPILHKRDPIIIAWWSAAFPGFGHLLLGKYFRGFMLITWEIFINQYGKLNLAMVYSFNGEIEMAKNALNMRLLHLYIPVYLYVIWDSYRTTVDLNNQYKLANMEKTPIEEFIIKPYGINYLDKRSPTMALFWSLTIPSMGQIYQHRLLQGFFTLIWTVVIMYFSHFPEAFHYLLLGDIKKSTSIVDPQWLLYIPSLYFFCIYDAYTNTVELNKIFEKEQRRYLIKHYQPRHFKIKKGIKVT